VPSESESSAELPPSVAPSGVTALSTPAKWGATALFALLMSHARGLTLPATALVAAAGAAVWWMSRSSLPGSLGDTAAVSRLGVGIWAGVFVAFCLWELSAFLIGNDDAHPTFSMLTDPMLTWPPTRALAAFAWLSVGWYLLDR
jgi:hypothetical protein